MIGGYGSVHGTGSPVLSDSTSLSLSSSSQTPPTPVSTDMQASPLKDVLIESKGNLDEAASRLPREMPGSLEKRWGHLPQLNAIPDRSAFILPTILIGTKTQKSSTANVIKPIPEPTPQDSDKRVEREIVDFFSSKIPSPALSAFSTLHTSPTSCAIKAEVDHQDPILIEDDSEDDSIEENVTNLYESCLRVVSHEACRNALRLCNKNPEKAYQMLSLKHDIVQDNEIEVYGGKKCDSKVKAGKRPEKILERARAKSSILTRKRSLESPDRSPFKRARYTQEQYSFDSDEDVDGEIDTHLGPAEDWIKKTYPDKSTVVVILGAEEVARDNVPMRVLYDNFNLMKLHIEAAPSVGQSQLRIGVPNVSPETFDLAVQFAICSNITLERLSAEVNDKRAAEITTILALIDSATKLGLYNLADLVDNTASKLKDILCRDRFALRGTHIRSAYGLRESEPIKQLFVKATVRRFMEYDEDDNVGNDFDDDDEEDMNAAQQAAYSGSGFVFQSEFKRIPEFQKAVWKQVHRVMSSRDKVTERPQRGKTPAIIVAYYTDPLTERRFVI